MTAGQDGGRRMPGTGTGRIGRQELIARAALGMPACHPERLTRSPVRAERKLLAAWCAELWPHDEYTAIVTEAWRHGPRDRLTGGD